MHLEKFQYNKHKSLLEKYYQHSDTPINNRSEKMFKPWLWDDKNGACWLIIDSDEIVATYACLKIEFDKNVAIKKSMRLHIRSDYHKFFNKIYYQYFDPACYDWMQEHKLENIFMTVNHNKPKTFINLCRNHSRIKYHLDHYSTFAKNILVKDHTILPFMVLEKTVWQFVAWRSDIPWQKEWRETSAIDPTVVESFNKYFKVSDFGWSFKL
jgi:hypothetical protein